MKALQARGFDAWLNEQLAPSKLQDSAAEERVRGYRSALTPAEQLRAFRALRGGRAAAPELADEEMPGAPTTRREFRALAARAQMLQLSRFVESERQLLEVMTDFWSNHFNVYARKGPVRFLASDYVENTLRPRALGKFGDLLLATAKHPAMLVYLDNAQSVKPKAGSMAEARGRGLNENYARELLELHTLGVDGGYTQHDVQDVARVFTGWSVTRPASGQLSYVFRKRQHDAAAKRILSQDFPAGQYEAEGMRLIKALAAHPATARHLSRKLCARFVSDTPDETCVKAASEAYLATEGDISMVVRAIVKQPSFWTAENQRSKVKSPLELVVSSVRAVDGHVDGTTGLAETLSRLGQPLFMYAAPTGYPENGEAWLGPGQALSRMRFGIQFASGRVNGAEFELLPLLPLTDNPARASAAVNRVFFDGTLGAEAEAAITAELTQLASPDRVREHAVAFAVGGPDFQRQ